MGTKQSKRSNNKGSPDLHDEVPYVPAQDLAISDQDIRRLWSYHSTSGGRYVYMTNDTVLEDNEEEYVVAATGEAEGINISLTDITFVQKRSIPLMFELKFEKNNTPYTLQASESGVTASQVSSDSWFEVIILRRPNQPFVALRSIKKKGNHDLYLSSDGAGKMKLKVANQPLNNPAAQVDPALLFRVVKP